MNIFHRVQELWPGHKFSITHISAHEQMDRGKELWPRNGKKPNQPELSSLFKVHRLDMI